MKKIFNLFLMLAIASTFTLTSCKTEGCTDPTATNYDEKADDDDGSCTYQRDALIGTYTVSGTVNCDITEDDNVPSTPLVIATSSIATNKIALTYEGITITCTVTGSTFVVDNQTVGGFSYTGQGSVLGNLISLVMNEYDPLIDETCIYDLDGTRN
jgi:hypothetical protein